MVLHILQFFAKKKKKKKLTKVNTQKIRLELRY